MNSSLYFHICDGLATAIMHDALEGSLQYEVNEVLKNLFFPDRILILEQLNKSIAAFPCALSDRAIKSSIIAPQVLAVKDHTLRQKGVCVYFTY